MDISDPALNASEKGYYRIVEIIKRTEDILDQFSNKHIVLTGGRGFLGRYLTEIFFRYNQILNQFRHIIKFLLQEFIT